MCCERRRKQHFTVRAHTIAFQTKVPSMLIAMPTPDSTSQDQLHYLNQFSFNILRRLRYDTLQCPDTYHGHLAAVFDKAVSPTFVPACSAQRVTELVGFGFVLGCGRKQAYVVVAKGVV